MRPQSLRMRLIVIILTPLLLIALVAAAWQFRNATQRAEDIFDRGLLSAALAISRDVAVSGGDALGPDTRRLISGTSGGELFYHVFAPDGVFVTGYATPPVAPRPADPELPEPLFYDATYQGNDVRVLRFQDAANVDGVTGLFTITVWQNAQVRSAFVNDVTARAVGVIGLLVASVALIVWFGVSVGLRPLLDLQDAIAKRTEQDLDPIQRAVPAEARGIVLTLNRLLDRVSRRISSKDEFIANAAHQLRNPIAGVLALAEAVESAPTPEAAKSRSRELVTAARDATHLTNQLLSFERAAGADLGKRGEVLDLGALIRAAVDRFTKTAPAGAPAPQIVLPADPAPVWGDAVMLQEAVLNILNNAVLHGGPDLSQITVTLSGDAESLSLAVEDDGRGIDPEAHLLALGRFTQARAGQGTGLGLPIAARVMENHGGRLTLEPRMPGARVALHFPHHGAGPSVNLPETRPEGGSPR